MRVKLPHKDLSEAFVELNHAAAEAEEEGFAIPSDLAVVNAEHLNLALKLRGEPVREGVRL